VCSSDLDTLGAFGTVQSTNSAPFQWKPIGIARGNPSGPTYANRAGILDCISSCANGSLSTRATSCCCIITSLQTMQAQSKWRWPAIQILLCQLFCSEPRRSKYATRDDDGIRLKCPEFRRVFQHTSWVPYVILVDERCSVKSPPYLAHLMRSPSIRTHSGGFNS
jgi:hypothetical protein